MRNFIRNIIIFTISFLPFVFISKSFYGLVFPKSLFFEASTLAIGLLFLIGKSTKKDMGVFPKNLTFLIFGSYVFILILSCVFGLVPSLSFWGSFDQGTGLVFMICLFVFSVITSTVFKNKEDWYKLFTFFVLAGIIFTIGSILGETGINFSKYLDLNIRNGFLIGNSSWTGIYIAIVFFVSAGLFFGSENKTQKIIGFLGMIISFFNPILTGFFMQAPGAKFGFIGLARAGSYSIFAGIFLFLLYIVFRRIKIDRFRKIFLNSLAISFGAFLIIFFIWGIKPTKNFIIEKAGPNRLIYWNIAIEGFKERPIFGWGGDTYQYVYARYFNPIITTDVKYAKEYWVDRSHNYYMDELASSGMLGFIFLVSIYFIVLYKLGFGAIKNFDNKNGYIYMGLLSAFLSYLIQGIMIFQTIFGWVFVGLVISFIVNSEKRFQNSEILKIKESKQITNTKDANYLYIFFIIGLFIIFLNYLIIKPYKINNKMGKFPLMPYNERIEFFKELDNFYMGNMVDMGNAFLPYQNKMRSILKRDLSEKEKGLAINEFENIVLILENSSKKQHDMDVKNLTSIVTFYSFLIAISDEEKKDDYYNRGIANVEKIKDASPNNPISGMARSLLDISYQYREESFTIFDS